MKIKLGKEILDTMGKDSRLLVPKLYLSRVCTFNFQVPMPNIALIGIILIVIVSKYLLKLHV